METITQDTLKKSNVEKIQRDFSRFVHDFSDIGVLDYEYTDDKVCVFVDFDYCLRELVIKNIEILDNDYEPIHNKYTLTLRCFFEEIVADYNRDQDNLEKILSEETEYRHYVMRLYY